MLHVILRADLPRHVVVPDHVRLRIQAERLADPGRQIHQAGVGPVGEASRRVGMADLDPDRIAVAVVGRVGHLRQGHALDHLSVQAHDEVTAGVGPGPSVGQGGEIVPVGAGGRAGVAHVVDHHAVDLTEPASGTGPLVDGDQVLLHVVRDLHAVAGEPSRGIGWIPGVPSAGEVRPAQDQDRRQDQPRRQHRPPRSHGPSPGPFPVPRHTSTFSLFLPAVPDGTAGLSSSPDPPPGIVSSADAPGGDRPSVL